MLLLKWYFVSKETNASSVYHFLEIPVPLKFEQMGGQQSEWVGFIHLGGRF